MMRPSKSYLVIAALVVTIGHQSRSANEPRIPEFVLEIQHPGSEIPFWLGTTTGSDGTSMVSFKMPGSSERRSALILYSRWLSSRQLSVRVEFYPDFPNMPRMEEQFLARLDRTDMGSHLLSVGQALRFNLPGTSERAEISLRRNVPDEPARLNIGESSIRSVEIGDIIETRGDFRIELINRSKAGIYALAFGHGGGGGEEQSVGHLNEPLVAPGESYYGRLEAHLEYLVRSGMIPRRELD